MKSKLSTGQYLVTIEATGACGLSDRMNITVNAVNQV